jgi:hypothetical protein
VNTKSFIRKIVVSGMAATATAFTAFGLAAGTIDPACAIDTPNERPGGGTMAQTSRAVVVSSDADSGQLGTH